MGKCPHEKGRPGWSGPKIQPRRKKPRGGRCPPGPNGGRRDAHSATPILLRGSLITRRWGGGVIDIDKKAPLARRPHHPKGDDSPLGEGPDTIATARQICENSNVDFNKNFYYLRIIVKSGIIAFQQMTVYGSLLISTR